MGELLSFETSSACLTLSFLSNSVTLSSISLPLFLLIAYLITLSKKIASTSTEQNNMGITSIPPFNKMSSIYLSVIIILYQSCVDKGLIISCSVVMFLHMDKSTISFSNYICINKIRHTVKIKVSLSFHNCLSFIILFPQIHPAIQVGILLDNL